MNVATRRRKGACDLLRLNGQPASVEHSRVANGQAHLARDMGVWQCAARRADRPLGPGYVADVCLTSNVCLACEWREGDDLPRTTARLFVPVYTSGAVRRQEAAS